MEISKSGLDGEKCSVWSELALVEGECGAIYSMGGPVPAARFGGLMGEARGQENSSCFEYILELPHEILRILSIHME